MRTCLVVALVSTLLVPTSVSAQTIATFDLASLKIGSSVLPLYVESDEHGPRLVIAAIPGAIVLVNPRKPPAHSILPGVFCYEMVPTLAELWPATNPRMNVIATTINIDGQVKVQLVDLDASDGVAPWVIIEPTFRLCR